MSSANVCASCTSSASLGGTLAFEVLTDDLLACLGGRLLVQLLHVRTAIAMPNPSMRKVRCDAMHSGGAAQIALAVVVEFRETESSLN